REGLATATRLLQEAQRRHPDDFWLNCQLSMHLTATRGEDHDGPLRFMAVAVGLRPNDAMARFNLATCLDAKGLLEEAVSEYQVAVSLDPNNEMGHRFLGETLARLG